MISLNDPEQNGSQPMLFTETFSASRNFSTGCMPAYLAIFSSCLPCSPFAFCKVKRMVLFAGRKYLQTLLFFSPFETAKFLDSSFQFRIICQILCGQQCTKFCWVFEHSITLDCYFPSV